MARPRIAVLDDDRAHLSVLRHVLEDEGYAVATLADLREGYRFVKHHRPALVVLDLVQDRQVLGLELIRLVRGDPSTRETELVVVSADTRTLRAQAAWFSAENIGALDKPYDLDDLLRLVRERVPPAEAPGGRSEGSPAGASGAALGTAQVEMHGETSGGGMPSILLIAGDTSSGVETLADVLRAFGYTVEVAPAERDALEVLRQVRPAALVADADEPDGPALAFVNACRADPAWRQLPVAVVVGRDELVDQVRPAGPLAVVRKPFRLVQLLRVVGMLLPEAPDPNAEPSGSGLA